MRNQQGFSLVEIVMFIIIVGIAVSAMSQLFVNNVVHSHEPLLRQKVIAVASAYMDEIINKRWDENSPTGGGCVDTSPLSTTQTQTCTATESGTFGPDGGELRSSYDDIDDFDGVSDSPPQYPDDTDLVDGKSPMTGYDANYTVTVAVTQPVTAGTLWNSVDGQDIRMIVVTVDNAITGESISLTAYRFNF